MLSQNTGIKHVACCSSILDHRPTPQHFYPTLLHIKAELEDGTTAPTKQGGSDVLSPEEPFSSEGSPARFGFDESVFPGHSWRGYASMSDLQVSINNLFMYFLFLFLIQY